MSKTYSGITTFSNICTDFNRDPQKGFRFRFEESFPEEMLPESIHIYVTSEQNAYGAPLNKFMNGDALKYDTKIRHNMKMSLKGEKFEYLQTKSGCTEQSFWNQWEPVYNDRAEFQKCPRKCSAISLPQRK